MIGLRVVHATPILRLATGAIPHSGIMSIMYFAPYVVQFLTHLLQVPAPMAGDPSVTRPRDCYRRDAPDKNQITSVVWPIFRLQPGSKSLRSGPQKWLES